VTPPQPRRSTVKAETKIARRRIRQFITQRQAAEAAGLAYWTYRRLEAGDLSDPGIRPVVNIALALRDPDEDLWSSLAELWEDCWPQAEWLTADDIADPEVGATRLRGSRDAAGRTQEELAAELGITARAYRSLESGKSDNPRLSLLVRAANFLGLALHEVCEERWLRWKQFPKHGAPGPGDLEELRAMGATLLPPEWI